MTDWREVMSSVPRRLFLPDVVWADLGPGPYERVDRASDPDRWAEVAEMDCPLVTQFQDGKAEGEGLASSSSSMPTMVAEFLEQLDPYDHHRVLEIGTGTGWTAALLSHRVGAGNVTTVEIDPDLSVQAQARLKTAGYEPRLVVGDGAQGFPEGAPYDRVHATCAVSSIPQAWIEQTRPGGVIVAPYSPGFGSGFVLRLVVHPDGTAMGRFAGSSHYMLLRSQRPAGGPARQWVQADPGRQVRISRTRFDPRDLRHGPLSLDLVVATLVRGVVSRYYSDEAGATLWVLDYNDHRGPWASVEYEPGRPDYEVQQAGDRDLWDEVQVAYVQWLEWGRPELSRFGLTITPAGSHMVWLDDPDHVI